MRVAAASPIVKRTNSPLFREPVHLPGTGSSFRAGSAVTGAYASTVWYSCYDRLKIRDPVIGSKRQGRAATSSIKS